MTANDSVECQCRPGLSQPSEAPLLEVVVEADPAAVRRRARSTLRGCLVARVRLLARVLGQLLLVSRVHGRQRAARELYLARLERRVPVHRRLDDMKCPRVHSRAATVGGVGRAAMHRALPVGAAVVGCTAVVDLRQECRGALGVHGLDRERGGSLARIAELPGRRPPKRAVKHPARPSIKRRVKPIYGGE
jgi:hypothetical protein